MQCYVKYYRESLSFEYLDNYVGVIKMNILFLALGKYKSINDRGIYLDLLRQFVRNGHEVFIVSSLNSELKKQYQLTEEEKSHILLVKTGRITMTNIIEKGINTLLLEGRYIRAINKFFSNVKFDLILYPTPPITFLKVVEYIKERDGAKSYLMLKDIFPQNAVDIEIMSQNGVRGLIYKYFRKREELLYKASDYIGCMSQANIDYLLLHNPSISADKVGICPNSVEVHDMSVDKGTAKVIREEYNIPVDKKVFIYGGNLGKPQGISFLIECLKKCADIEDVYFLIIGNGTEYKKIEEYVHSFKPRNVKIMQRIPKDDYDNMVGACDAGLIFLDHRFTIPNFPSRVLSYMQAKIPVLACTDKNTDIGNVIVDGGFGWWCESNNSEVFRKLIMSICKSDFEGMGIKGYQYLKENYSAEKCYSTIYSTICNPRML